MPREKTLLRVPNQQLDFLRRYYGNKIKEEYGFIPSDQKLVEIALSQLKATSEGKNIEIKFNKKTKWLKIQEI